VRDTGWTTVHANNKPKPVRPCWLELAPDRISWRGRRCGTPAGPPSTPTTNPSRCAPVGWSWLQTASLGSAELPRHSRVHTRSYGCRKSFGLGFSAKDPLQVLGKGYITKRALDTRWCHYQTLAPTQKGEKPAPEDENDREKGRNGHATPPGSTGTSAAGYSKIRHFLTGACGTAPTPSAALRVTHHAPETPTVDVIPRPLSVFSRVGALEPQRRVTQTQERSRRFVNEMSKLTRLRHCTTYVPPAWPHPPPPTAERVRTELWWATVADNAWYNNGSRGTWDSVSPSLLRRVGLHTRPYGLQEVLLVAERSERSSLLGLGKVALTTRTLCHVTVPLSGSSRHPEGGRPAPVSSEFGSFRSRFRWRWWRGDEPAAGGDSGRGCSECGPRCGGGRAQLEGHAR
jgi:hypothetical protein